MASPLLKKIITVGLLLIIALGCLDTSMLVWASFDMWSFTAEHDPNYWCSGYAPDGTLCDYTLLFGRHYGGMLYWVMVPSYLLWWLYKGHPFRISPFMILSLIAIAFLGKGVGIFLQDTTIAHGRGLTPQYLWDVGLWCSNGSSLNETSCDLGSHYTKITASVVIYILIPIYLAFRILKGRVRS